MSLLVLSEKEIEVNFKKVLSLLVESKASFTVFNITEILRSVGVYTKHSKIRSLFENIEYPDGYSVFKVTVDDNGTTALLHSPINFDLPENVRITIDIFNFEEIVLEYSEWFDAEYQFEYPEEGVENSVQSKNETTLDLLLQLISSGVLKPIE
jgi:hypothetical protein